MAADGKMIFFLGGYDLEMFTIRALLETHAPGRFFDKHLAWGAKASDYRAEIAACLAQGETPVLIELEDDLSLGGHCRSINHHGPDAAAAAPTALHQVFAALGLPPELWTRRLELVVANDRGYVEGMLAIGATAEEIREIRNADRAAQGITAEEEEQGEAALAGRQILGDGKLTVVQLPHNLCAVVTDRLAPELGGPGYCNLLVISPTEVNFFGDGAIVAALAAAFPGGWYGGSLPLRGFWGHGGPSPDLLPFLLKALCED